MITLEILLVIALLFSLLPVTVLFTQVLLAILPRRLTQIDSYRPSVAVLIPAHNEAVIITETLTALLPQLLAGDRIVVVADNCTDETALIVAKMGVELIERHDVSRRGKGYALDFGVRYLESNPPEVVVFIDADCTVHEGAIDKLSRLCSQAKKPVQALYLMHSPACSGLKSQISEFAWLVKNYVRPIGFLQLGLPCQLMGTGMAFPWQLISGASLASGHIVEDLKLGIDLARAGAFALFCPDALVTSYFPSNNEVIKNQRTRWEHGHLSVILSELPQLFREMIVRPSIDLMALILDLCVPPLALLTLLLVVAALGSLLLFWIYGITLPFKLSALTLTIFGSAILISWGKHGRHVISLGSLACVPMYVLWKIPLYLKFLFKKQGAWVKTKR